jgi:hypothetical protein
MYFGALVEILVLVSLPHVDLTFASPVFYVKMELAAFCVLVSFSLQTSSHSEKSSNTAPRLSRLSGV